jgi:uncharacterized protein
MSKVFFIDFHTHSGLNIFKKLEFLVEAAGIKQINFKKKLVAIKLHFGEPGNLAYIRPNYIAPISKIIKEMEGLPFLTDANTLYKGGRSNGVYHLQAAMENGFNFITTGCNLVIADGIKGTDYREIEINQKHCKTAKIGAAIADADILISMAHFKAHEMSGIGGCLKNIGMGSGSIGGKLEMHSDSNPVIQKENCTGCASCEENCAYGAIHLNSENLAEIDYAKCVGCGQCIAVCQYNAAQASGNSINMQEKMMEYAFAILRNKTAFHINFIMDVSPQCDCWGFNDIPIVSNIGILASLDPVAIDRASADLVNQAPVIKKSVLDTKYQAGEDKFDLVSPSTDWKAGLSYAESLGLGSQKYELLEVK